MEIIVHRINKIKELKKIPINFGVEIDIRSHKSKLILNHEPYKSGDSLDIFLNNYKHGTLILPPPANSSARYLSLFFASRRSIFKFSRYISRCTRTQKGQR